MFLIKDQQSYFRILHFSNLKIRAHIQTEEDTRTNAGQVGAAMIQNFHDDQSVELDQLKVSVIVDLICRHLLNFVVI